MRKWRHLGIDLQDDGTHLPDLRFVDDGLICPGAGNEVLELIYPLVHFGARESSLAWVASCAHGSRRRRLPSALRFAACGGFCWLLPYLQWLPQVAGCAATTHGCGSHCTSLQVMAEFSFHRASIFLIRTKWSISFEDSDVTIVVDMEANDFLPGRTCGALGTVPDLRTVWPAQSDPSITKVRLPSPGPSRAWMDYDVNGGTLTITVDPQTQLLAFDPVICAEIATYMEVICHSGTELGGESQDCTAAVSVCAAVSVWAAVLERAQPRMSLDQANSFRARLMTEFYKLADYQTLLDLEKFIRHISLRTPELQTSTDGNTPPLSTLLEHHPGNPPQHHASLFDLEGCSLGFRLIASPANPSGPALRQWKLRVWHRKGTRLHCAVKKACAGKKKFEGGILKPQLRTMIFIFRRKHVFMKTKKNVITMWQFGNTSTIFTLLCHQ